MRIRNKKGFYADRRQSTCTCKWCGESFISQRSDSKYCCDSHKTLASGERRRQKNEQEIIAEQRRRQLHIIQQKARVTNSVKPNQPIPRAVPEPSPEIWMDLEKSMKDMLDKTAQDMKLREQQRELARYNSMFKEIVSRMESCSQYGVIRYSDISDLQFKVSRILTDTNLRTIHIFQEKVDFVGEELEQYLQDLRIELRESGSRRIEFDPPPEIISGLEVLRNAIEASASR